MSIVGDIGKALAEIPLSAVMRERINLLLGQVRSLEQKVTELTTENASLRQENTALKKAEPDLEVCPFCRKPAGQLLRIEIDKEFGQHLKWYFYKCDQCGKEWDKDVEAG